MRGSHVFMLFTTVLMAAALSLRVDAESKYKACSLLTAAEAEAALDAKAARTRDGDMQAQGETVSNCIWGTASGTVAVSLFVGRLPAGMKPHDVAAAASGQMEQIKQQGGTVQAAVNTPDLWCARIVPPGSDSAPLAMCAGGSKGYSVTLNVHHQTATGQQAKTLFDKAMARLP